MRVTLAVLARVGLGLGLGAWALSPRAESVQADVQQAQGDEVSLLTINGMVCSGCAVAVKMAAKGVDGVKDAKVSYEEGTAEITYDASKTRPEAIAAVVSQKTGYEVSVAK